MTFRLAVLSTVCFLFASSSVSPQASTTQSDKTRDRAQPVIIEEGLDPTLRASLARLGKYTPFAWGIWVDKPKKGTILAVDAEGNLTTFEFAESQGTFLLRPAESTDGWNKSLTMSGSLDLRQYTDDWEFPFKSDIVTRGDCRVHFVLVWRALNRSFQKAFVLRSVDLRIIVERNGAVVSNEREGLKMVLGIDEASVKDLNGDGDDDYLLIHKDNYQHIGIWSVNPAGRVRRLAFKGNEGTSTSLVGRNVFVKRAESGGGFSVHTKSYELVTHGTDPPRWRVTEEVYTWDNRESVFKVGRKSTWFEQAD